MKFPSPNPMNSLPGLVAILLATGSVGAAQEPTTKPEEPEKRMAKDVPADHPPIIIEKPPVEEKATAEAVQKALKKISATEYELSGMHLNVATRELRLPCVTKIINGPLEYLVVTERGAVHEALFVTKNNPFQINVALLLLGFKPSESFFHRASMEEFPRAMRDPKIEMHSQFDVLVEYNEAPGKLKTVPAENWVRNLRTKDPLTPGPWVYNGSFLTKEGNLAAEGSGNVLSLYLDPVALANNPRQDNELDDNWKPMENLPAEDTPVTIIFKLRKEGPADGPKPTKKPTAAAKKTN
jgi:hypothetical protein